MLKIIQLQEIVQDFLDKKWEELYSSSGITHLHYCDAGWGKKGIYCIDSYSPFVEGEYESSEDYGVINLADGQVQYAFVHHGNLQCWGLCQLIYQLAEKGEIELH